MGSEIARLLRHLIAPLVAYMAAQGWLPEYMKGDVTEVFVIGLPFAGAFFWSWWRDRRKNKGQGA